MASLLIASHSVLVCAGVEQLAASSPIAPGESRVRNSKQESNWDPVSSQFARVTLYVCLSSKYVSCPELASSFWWYKKSLRIELLNMKSKKLLPTENLRKFSKTNILAQKLYLTYFSVRIYSTSASLIFRKY